MTCDCAHDILCDTAAAMKTQRDEALQRYYYDPDEHNWQQYQTYDAAFQRHVARAKNKATQNNQHKEN
jgi:hypothetical protein